MNTEAIKALCAAIVAHDQWSSLQAYLLMHTAPSSGIDTLRNAITHIQFLGDGAEGEFKKPSKKTKQPIESNIDPDLDENE
jgi:hypothetical protein